MTGTQHTVLYEIHQQAGASFTDFGGWQMPLRYQSELAEHRAVRTAAGMFDLSHLGQVWVRGADAVTALNTALVGNFAPMAVGRAKYSLMLTDQGTIIDDLIIYRMADEEFLVVPNAGNTTTVHQQLVARTAGFEVWVADVSADTALIAVQGPLAERILRNLLDVGGESHPETARVITDMGFYTVTWITLGGVSMILARTGYTGEDGFELMMPQKSAPYIWEQLRKVGGEALTLCGLAARDSLRLEAGMPLYGNELSEHISPLQAHLEAVVSWQKPEDFVGKTALAAQRDAHASPVEKSTGLARVLVGLKGHGKRAGRSGYPIQYQGEVIGEITSGIPSPTLGYPIALGYVDPAYREPGTRVEVEVRGKTLPYEVVALPFYTRSQSVPLQ